MCNVRLRHYHAEKCRRKSSEVHKYTWEDPKMVVVSIAFSFPFETFSTTLFRITFRDDYAARIRFLRKKKKTPNGLPNTGLKRQAWCVRYVFLIKPRISHRGQICVRACNVVTKCSNPRSLGSPFGRALSHFGSFLTGTAVRLARVVPTTLRRTLGNPRGVCSDESGGPP
jgi:hypothetical protein